MPKPSKDLPLPITGMSAWRVKRGCGSFLTCEFGKPITVHGTQHGEYHLWIYQCAWSVRAGAEEIANSESDDRAIDRAAERLANKELESVCVDGTTSTFCFGVDMELITSPYTADDDKFADAELWMLFVPGDRVLTFGRSGQILERSATRA